MGVAVRFWLIGFILAVLCAWLAGNKGYGPVLFGILGFSSYRRAGALRRLDVDGVFARPACCPTRA